MSDANAESGAPQGGDAGALDDARRVTVCSVCLCASCWLGEFFCDEYKNAGTVEKTVAELRALNREHSDYWKPGRAHG